MATRCGGYEVVSLSAITNLLALCGPATIAGFVSEIVVDPVERLAGRSLSHVSEEILELMPPAADLDASAAVSSPMMWCRDFTAAKHGVPADVSRRPWSSVAVGEEGLFTPAAARFGVTAHQGARICFGFAAAVASASPDPLGVLSSYDFDRHQATETLPFEMKHHEGSVTCL